MARSRSIGGIYAELALKDGKFKKGLKSAERSLNNFAKAIPGIAAQAAKVAAVTGGAFATALAAGAKHTAAMGAELDHLSDQTGVSVASLMKLQQAYKDAGKGAETAGKDINKMQQAIYDAAQNPGGSEDPFAQMGLSAERLMAMSPERQFYTIAQAIDGIGNRTKQTALAMDVFGRSGGELLTVFKGADLEDVEGSLGRMPALMEDFSGALERVDTLMGRLPNKTDQFFTGFTTGIVGELLPGLETVDDFDFTQLGENLGDNLAHAISIVTDGTAWELFTLHAEKAIAQLQTEGLGLFNAWAAGINATWEGITGQGGPDYDWGASFDKFADAGNIENRKIIEDLEARIADIMARTEAAALERKSAAAAIGKEDAAPVIQLEPSAMQKVVEKLEEAVAPERSWEMTRYEVNEMQRRGLGFGAFTRNEEGKQVTLLERIHDTLKEAADNGGNLSWA